MSAGLEPSRWATSGVSTGAGSSAGSRPKLRFPYKKARGRHDAQQAGRYCAQIFVRSGPDSARRLDRPAIQHHVGTK